VFVTGQRDCPPLGPSADRPGVVEVGAALAAAGEDEALQGVEFVVVGVHPRLEVIDVGVPNVRGIVVPVGVRELGLDHVEVVLDGGQLLVDVVVPGRPGPTEEAVEFVDGPVRLDPGARLRDAGRVPEVRHALVAAAGVYPHAGRFAPGWLIGSAGEANERPPGPGSRYWSGDLDVVPPSGRRPLRYR
jgi:hypothetical protein